MTDEVKQPDPAASTKKPWLSKTLITNLVLAVTAVVCPPVQVWISAHPEVSAMVWSGVNAVLRLVTKDAISLQD